MKITIVAAGVLATAAVLSGGGVALAQQPTQQPGGQLSQQDRMWLMQNAQTDLAEITSGGLAARKGATPAIRSTGQDLMNDHQQVLNQLKQIAQANKVTLPTTPNQTQQQEAQQLQTSAGPAFDQTYVQKEIQGHQMSISNTQQEIKSGSNPQIKQFAQGYLPKAQQHLQRLQNDQKQK